MEKCRVNRITVNVNKKLDDTTISLYKTNTLLGMINSDDLGIDSFEKSGVSMRAYQAYCKDIVINLLDNDGVYGYYYDPKEEQLGVKYDISSLANACMENVSNTLDGNYNWRRTYNDDTSQIEQYNDKFIRNARCLFEILIEGYDVKIRIIAEIKSGQLCRPKSFVYDDTEYTFNITNINRIIKSL